MKLKAAIYRFFSPGYSWCEKCKMPWNHVQSKTVTTRRDEHGSSGTFATCQKCWDNSSLEELKQYYTKVYLWQKAGLEDYNNRWPEQEPATMGHTLEHLLKCVETEYYLTH